MTKGGVDVFLDAFETIHEGALHANSTLFSEMGSQDSQFVVDANHLTKETEVGWCFHVIQR